MTATTVAQPAATGPTSGPAALEARSLYRFFRAGEEETLALRGVSLCVHRGETVAVVGPSGSGKSTLLACLAGLDEPAGGSVTVGGERVSHRPERQRAAIRANRIGILLQTRNLLAHLDLTANIRLAQRAATPPRSDGDGRVGPRKRRPSTSQLLDRVGLAARASALPRQLSGGELARAGLAVALANAPDVVLADEPTGELDGVTEQQVLALLRGSAADGAGLLIVTHSRAVTKAADRVITLTDGQVRP